MRALLEGLLASGRGWAEERGGTAMTGATTGVAPVVPMRGKPYNAAVLAADVRKMVAEAGRK